MLNSQVEGASAPWPSMRDDLEVKRARDADGSGVLVTDPRTGELFEFGDEDLFLLRCMDGRSGLQTTMQLFEQRFGKRIGEQQLREFVGMVHEWGLIRNGEPWARPAGADAGPGAGGAGGGAASGAGSDLSEEDYEALFGSDLGGEFGLADEALSGELLGAGQGAAGRRFGRGAALAGAGGGARTGGMIGRRAALAGAGGLGGGGRGGGGGRSGPPSGPREPGAWGRMPFDAVEDASEPGMWEQFEQDDKKLTLALFRPHGLCAFIAAALRPFRLLLLAMPLLAGVGLATVINNLPAFAEDLVRYRSPVSLILRLLFSFVTVNLVTELARGVIAAGLGGDARMFGIRLVLGLIPRFHTSVAGIANFSRRDVLWMYGGPILVRTVLFGVGVVVWWATRDSGTLAPAFAIMLSAVAVISLILSCNPLAPNNDGYHVLAAMLQIPDLRRRANRALVAKFRRGVESDSDADRALRAYAMGSLIFLFVLAGVALWLVAQWLELNYQGTGVVIFLALLLYMVLYMRGQIREQRQRRAEQRRRAMSGQYRAGVPALAGAARGGALAAGGGDAEHPKHRSNPLIGWMLLLVLGVVAMLPYNYQPGGPVNIMPAQQRAVHTEIAGLLDEVLVKGGEYAEAGSVIARMSAQEEQRSVQTTRAEIAEQQARLEELIARPRVEDVRLARQQLETARVQLRFSTEEAQRLRKLSEDGFVSNEEYQEAVRRQEVDRARVLEAEANLTRVSTPAHPKEIEAAEAKLEGLRQELAYHEGQLERTILRMPFDGRVVTINLKDKEGQFLDKGAFFATVENAESVRVQFRIPQSDVAEISIGGETLVKFWAYPGRTFTGEIVDISPAVEEEDQGEVVIVTTVIPNDDGLLKSGMTGFGKVRGERKTVLEVFSRAMVRFFLVEMWSWLP